MSVTFTLVGIVPKEVALLTAFRAISDELLPLGFGPRGMAWRFSYDRDGDEYQDGPLITATALDLLATTASLDDASGLSAQFQGSEAAFDLRLGRQPDGTGICFLDANDRVLYRYFADGKAEELRAILAACARGAKAPIAVGAMELGWELWNHARIREAILHGPPDYEGSAPPFGLMPRQSFVEALVAERFNIHAVGDYWVLERKGLSELYASLPR